MPDLSPVKNWKRDQRKPSSLFPVRDAEAFHWFWKGYQDAVGLIDAAHRAPGTAFEVLAPGRSARGVDMAAVRKVVLN